MSTISYIEFCTYPLPKKIDFFDNGLTAIIQSVEDNQLYKFLREIILNITENAFVRKSAISTLVESAFLGKIKDRQVVSILVDEWEVSPHLFLELQRIKDLFYFYENEPDVQNIYLSYLESEEIEIVTEARLNLGFINLQKGFEAGSKEDKIKYFQEANKYFIESYKSIENRIDARFYNIVSSILLDLLSLKTANIENQLSQLSEIIKEKWLNSFDFKENVLDVSFYKTLTSIANILKKMPEKWIDYPKEFNKLYECYADVKNQEIKNRLNQSKLSQAFATMSNEAFIEPYFALNYRLQIVKIDNCIQKYPKGSPLYDFLSHIKKLAENTEYKKKVDTETIEQKLRNSFPERSVAEIEKMVKKIRDKSNYVELINAYDELNSDSIGKLIDTIISACLKLQANRIYKGDYSEDDRNTYISDLLDISGHQTKDQTRQGTSYAGKSAGEIDILIKDSRGLPFTIIEALNLVSVDKEYIRKHIDKLFNNYDTAGLESNFILVYANVKNFENFFKKYIDYISTKHSYKYTFKSGKELENYLYTSLKVYEAEHIRQGKKVFLYHVIINLSE